MKNAINRTLDNTVAALSALHGATRGAGPQVHNNDWLVLAALTPPILAAYALTEAGLWTLREIQRQIRIHEKRPASPSLRGTPSPADLRDAWEADPRTLETRLRLGSRLSDLDPTLDRTVTRRTLPNGKTLIKSRAGGMKGWLADRRIAIPYSTVMRYKKLVQRLRQILALDDRIPFEWLIDGVPPDAPLLSDLAAAPAAARRRLGKILRGNRSLASLTRYAEKKLGIVRLVTVRKVPSHQKSCARGRRKQRENRAFTVISHGRRVTIAPGGLERTRSAIQSLLATKNPSPGTLRLRNRIRRWMDGLH